MYNDAYIQTPFLPPCSHYWGPQAAPGMPGHTAHPQPVAQVAQQGPGPQAPAGGGPVPRPVAQGQGGPAAPAVDAAGGHGVPQAWHAQHRRAPEWREQAVVVQPQPQPSHQAQGVPRRPQQRLREGWGTGGAAGLRPDTAHHVGQQQAEQAQEQEQPAAPTETAGAYVPPHLRRRGSQHQHQHQQQQQQQQQQSGDRHRVPAPEPRRDTRGELRESLFGSQLPLPGGVQERVAAAPTPTPPPMREGDAVDGGPRPAPGRRQQRQQQQPHQHQHRLLLDLMVGDRGLQLHDVATFRHDPYSSLEGSPDFRHDPYTALGGLPGVERIHLGSVLPYLCRYIANVVPQEIEEACAAFDLQDTSSLADDKKVCTVCLLDFAKGDRVRALPCLHLFHVDCIDIWIAENDKCPTCRASVTDLITKAKRLLD